MIKDIKFQLINDLSQSDVPLVAILLGTYNGTSFISQQLDSILAQTYQNWILIVSDDGSTDQTIEILHHYQVQLPAGKLKIQGGPKKGFCKNFLSLACDTKIKADYFAFCDQDDVWMPEKLSVAITTIKAYQRPYVPIIYCGRTQYVTKELKHCGKSPLFAFPTSFNNALVQSIAGGNSMVFNLAAKSLIEKVGVVDVPSHDWWLYQLISGAGGVVIYDPIPQILYRQHENSLVGGNNKIFAKMYRVLMLFQGRFQNWNTQNIAALKKIDYLLLENNQTVLKMFEALREANLINRLRLIWGCGLYRQSYFGKFSLIVAILIKKI